MNVHFQHDISRLFISGKNVCLQCIKAFCSSPLAVPSFGNKVTLVTVILFMPPFGKLYNILVSFTCNGKIFKQQLHWQSEPIKILRVSQGLFILCLLDHTRREVEASFVTHHKLSANFGLPESLQSYCKL